MQIVSTIEMVVQCHCPTRDDGCDWSGKTNQFQKHLENCSRIAIACRNAGCEMIMKRSEMGTHEVSCTWKASHNIPCCLCFKEYERYNNKMSGLMAILNVFVTYVIFVADMIILLTI